MNYANNYLSYIGIPPRDFGVNTTKKGGRRRRGGAVEEPTREPVNATPTESAPSPRNQQEVQAQKADIITEINVGEAPAQLKPPAKPRKPRAPKPPPVMPVVAPAKPRGRPRKAPAPVVEPKPEPVKPSRGRPRKAPAPVVEPVAVVSEKKNNKQKKQK